MKKSVDGLKQLEISRKNESVVSQTPVENVFDTRKKSEMKLDLSTRLKENLDSFSPIKSNKDRLMKHEKSVLSLFSPIKPASKSAEVAAPSVSYEFPSFIEQKSVLKPMETIDSTSSNAKEV